MRQGNLVENEIKGRRKNLFRGKINFLAVGGKNESKRGSFLFQGAAEKKVSFQPLNSPNF